MKLITEAELIKKMKERVEVPQWLIEEFNSGIQGAVSNPNLDVLKISFQRKNISPQEADSFVYYLREAGYKVFLYDDCVRVFLKGTRKKLGAPETKEDEAPNTDNEPDWKSRALLAEKKLENSEAWCVQVMNRLCAAAGVTLSDIDEPSIEDMEAAIKESVQEEVKMMAFTARQMTEESYAIRRMTEEAYDILYPDEKPEDKEPRWKWVMLALKNLKNENSRMKHELDAALVSAGEYALRVKEGGAEENLAAGIAMTLSKLVVKHRQLESDNSMLKTENTVLNINLSEVIPYLCTYDRKNDRCEDCGARPGSKGWTEHHPDCIMTRIMAYKKDQPKNEENK
jgi:hypothetical protein